MKRRDFIMLAGAGFLAGCGSNGGSNPPSAAPLSRGGPSGFGPVCRARASSNASNTIAAENALAGVSDWVLTKPDSSQIEGYATTSVNVGSPVSVYVNTKSASYSVEVYRLGWYGGAGASLKRQLGPFPGSVQASASIDAISGAASCSWNKSFSIDTTGFVTGIYLVKLTTMEGYQQYVYFIVRDDSRTGDILFVSSSSTMQAYNAWGGKSLYPTTTSTAATAVSYNRPYEPVLASDGAGQILAWDIKVLHFLESHGLDVCYSDILDLHNASPTGFRCVLISGHSEYWSKQARSNLQSAAGQGVNTFVVAGNVCYKQVTFNADLMRYNRNGSDPNTGVFQRFDPEESFFGQTYLGYDGIHVPADFVITADIPAWMLDGTSLASGSKLPGLFGYEGDKTTSRTPSSAVTWGNSPFPAMITAVESRTEFGVATYYSSGDRSTGCSYQVLNVGSMNWAYGLGSAGYNMTNPPTNYENADAKQITLNVINRFVGGS